MGWGAKAVMALLFGLSFWSVAIMFDRHRALKSAIGLDDAKAARALIASRDWKGLSAWAAGRETIAGRAMRAAIEAGDATVSIERAVRGTLLEERTALEKGLTVLATLGSNAPFIGLFGTVLGIIQAFAVLSSTQTGMGVVMSGIAEALVSTAIGLFVAIPAVVAYNVFTRRLRVALVDCEALRDLYLARVALARGA